MRHLLIALALFGAAIGAPATAQNGPTVVELYTSQGCSSCPPADAMLHDLAKYDDVIALALHVDYWDYIGWKDSFGRPENTARQNAYARAANATTIYTPQMVINGLDHVVGSRPIQVMETVQAHANQPNPVEVEVTRRGNRVEITAETRARGNYTVQLVRYIPEETVDIRRGENAGRQLTYANIVTDWDVVDRWDGRDDLEISTPVSGDKPIVVIIQQSTNGPIVGAAHLR
ncbi:MAG: DUF1223 domain-containing protein [Pseudomonadota bacterium]